MDDYEFIDEENIGGKWYGYTTAPWGDSVEKVQCITKVVVGGSIENIGEAAFYGVASLTSVEMPNVKYIGVQAFAATGITYANIPSNAETCVGPDCTLMSDDYCSIFACSPLCPSKWAGISGNCTVENETLICDSCHANGQVPYKDQCWDEFPFAKKKWTPAEAVKWLKEDDNTVTITFKK